MEWVRRHDEQIKQSPTALSSPPSEKEKRWGRNDNVKKKRKRKTITKNKAKVIKQRPDNSRHQRHRLAPLTVPIVVKKEEKYSLQNSFCCVMSCLVRVLYLSVLVDWSDLLYHTCTPAQSHPFLSHRVELHICCEIQRERPTPYKVSQVMSVKTLSCWVCVGWLVLHTSTSKLALDQCCVVFFLIKPLQSMLFQRWTRGIFYCRSDW